MPRGLSASAQATWRELVGILEERHTLTIGDAPALLAYVQVSERLGLAQQELVKHGLVIESTVLDAKGRPATRSKANPAVKIAESCERLLHEFRRQMGLTPRSRDVVKPLQRQREDARSSPVLAILKKAEALVQ
jgi:P27 family predicted phage terminase small subunit